MGRHVQADRKILFVLLEKQTLTDESIQIIMCEIEATKNSHPITKVSSDLNNMEAITPNQFLLLKTKPNLPPDLFDKNEVYA